MKLMYDPEAETLYIRITDQFAARSEEKADKVIMRDKMGNVCAVAVKNAHQFKAAKALTLTDYLIPKEIAASDKPAQQLVKSIQADL